MKKWRAIAWMLIAVLLFSGCSDGTQNATESEEGTLADSGELVVEATLLLAKNGMAEFEIIIPETCDEDVVDAANELKKELKKATGVVFMVYDDATQGGVLTAGSNEIVIGDCRRTASKTVMKDLTYRDYTVTVLENNVVIGGYSTDELVDGVNALIDLLDDAHVVKDGNDVYLNWTGDIHQVYDQYKFESICLNGVPLSKYRIVYPSDVRQDEYLDAAFEVQKSIGERCGYVLDIVTDATNQQTYEILIGETNRVESVAYYNGDDAVMELEYGFQLCGDKIQIACGGSFSVPQAAKLFETAVLKKMTAPSGILDGVTVQKESLTQDATIPDCKGEYRFMSYNILVEKEGWGSGGLIPSSVKIRKEAVAGLLLRYLPDVVGLQEASEQWSKALFPEISDVYAVVETSRSDGTANAVPLLYNKNRLTLIESGSEDLGDKVGHITWGLFEDKNNGTRFLYFSTHLDPRDQALKLTEAGIYGNLITTLKERFNVPAFAAGDYNSGKDSEQCARFKEVSGLELLSPSTGVDHIFGENVEVVAGAIERGNYAQYASDHYPIWVDVNFK